MSRLEPSRRPVSTYRLQLHGGFGFSHARSIASYLAQLGVTDCYSSPHFKANPGSRHGYDICDHGALNPELGSQEDYDAFCAALNVYGLGHIVDFVPNHMAADPRSNAWWRDVLENGPSSPFAVFFDIDWHPVKPELYGKVLLPVLGDQYGRVLERGELQLRVENGALHLRYFDLDLPINPPQAPRVLGLHVDRLEQEMEGDPALREYLSILTALQHLPVYTERDPGRITERQREKEVARERLARLMAESPAVHRHIDAVVREANGVAGNPASFDKLHELLENQAYRLAYWRTASDEINYRRFFDINELVGLRMEERSVFDAAHALLKRLVADGKVTGVRVDHPDGLFDPASYFERLQEMVGTPFYVVAEKILAPGESLCQDWHVAGTTGYGFLNSVSGLFVDPRHVRTLRRSYSRLTGRTEAFEEVAYRARLTVMLTAMASELNVLADALNQLSETDRRSRDFTLSNCRRVLREMTACFPVYRTYINASGASDFDRNVIAAAIAEARRRNPVMESSIFDFLRDVLLPVVDTQRPTSDSSAEERLHFTMKVQQFTAPVQAKGVEDTAFYRYHALISANDVGGHPSRPAVAPDDFHASNSKRLIDWPLELLATTTHDTKRGEDARARIGVVSEIPDEWRKAVVEWMRINSRNRTKVQRGWAPDRNEEYLFYQALLGTWPAETASTPVPEQASKDLAGRLASYMTKAVREAKVHTSWIHENEEYGRAVEHFVSRTLTGRTAGRFLASFVPFQRRVAHMGMVNSLAQLVLKLTSPGVPDFYQGTELWDLSLVDPDNRRAVDFDTRQTLLEALRPLIGRLEAGEVVDREVSELIDSWVDARIKLFITTCGLHFRRAHADLLLQGAYQPLEVEGSLPDHIVAFARHDASGTLLAIVPRLIVPLARDSRSLPLGSGTWGTTRVLLPPGTDAAHFRHLLTGETVHAMTGHLPAAAVFRTCPVGLMWADTRRKQQDAAIHRDNRGDSDVPPRFPEKECRTQRRSEHEFQSQLNNARITGRLDCPRADRTGIRRLLAQLRGQARPGLS
jgi:(1->4)-alpha-D-glucan 1-alpha-D-glucosylmutase